MKDHDKFFIYLLSIISGAAVGVLAVLVTMEIFF